ncbi:MAG: hypothetical protein HOP29_10405 [Phycisphaerales bacterium]|nr:hypothetical protein [Phycisphaerales bacterium]
MAKVSRTNGFASRLRDALVTDLAQTDIKAKVETELVRGTRLHRVWVIAPKFARLRPRERQDLVWRIVDRHFNPDDQLRISMIFTVTPSELPDE